MSITQPIRRLRSVGPQSRFHHGRGGAALLVEARVGKPAGQVFMDANGTLQVTLEGRGGSVERALRHALSRRLGIAPRRIEIVASRGRNRWLVAFYDISPADLERLLA